MQLCQLLFSQPSLARRSHISISSESLLSFVAASAHGPSLSNVVEGLASSGRSARALFPQGKVALITAAAAAAAAGAGGLHMVLFCAERPLPEFLPQDSDSVAKVNTAQYDCQCRRVGFLAGCIFISVRMCFGDAVAADEC